MPSIYYHCDVIKNKTMKETKTTIRTYEDLIKKVKERAKKNKRSMNAEIEFILEKALNIKV